MTLNMPQYHLTVVGGGITGASVALAASLRGLRVALFEKHDFGSGASTATSKLAHGGLRYLEQRQFRLVQESLNERNYLLNAASHTVRPLQFYVPLYKHSLWSPWQLKLGLRLYDFLQTKRSLPRHQMIDKTRLGLDIPWLKTEGLRACAGYYDAQMEDHRLLIETLRMAHNAGAAIQNYSHVTDIQAYSNSVGFDVVGGRDRPLKSYRSDTMVMATGAWSNSCSPRRLVRPTKGVHVVLPDMGLHVALLLTTPQDGRIFFVMPWQGKTLLGTTDDADDGAYDTPTVSHAEAQYLLTALNAYTLNREWQIDDIYSVFCGYRPLISSNEAHPSNQSREESYDWIAPSILSITGGKYTTFRAMGKRGVNAVVARHFKSCRWVTPAADVGNYIGLMSPSDWPSEAQLKHLTQKYHVSRESLMHLMTSYGALYKPMLTLIDNRPELAVQFDIAYPMILAELQYAIEHEWVQSVADFLFRRTYYGYVHAHHRDLITAIVLQFSQLTGTLVEDISDTVDQLLVRSWIESSSAQPML
ncbi:MAG: FAD-dependent oxidoreductase [Candidatus Marinamargulisbacteria bacterium]